MGIGAEGVGFEPTVTHKATTVFETAPIGHSGTPPQLRWHYTKLTDSRKHAHWVVRVAV